MDVTYFIATYFGAKVQRAVTGILVPVISVLGTNFFVENFGSPGPVFFENNGPL